MKQKQAISAASCKLPSTLRVEAISPKESKIGVNSATVGIKLTPEQAVELGTILLAVAHSLAVDGQEIQGVIHITGHKSTNNVTVIRRKKGHCKSLSSKVKKIDSI